MKIKNITIIGGGNIGTLVAADLKAYGGFNVTMLTSDPSRWSYNIKVLNRNDEEIKSIYLDTITSSKEEAFKNADMVICTLPSHVYHANIDEYLSHLGSQTLFGVMPGMGAKEFPFSKNKNYFAFQRVTGVSRLKKYGHEVYDLGKRDLLHIGSFDKELSQKLCEFFEPIFDIPCTVIDNLLSITLTPSNPILHTSRLYRLGKSEPFDHRILFYKEWDDLSSEIIIDMDNEVQELAHNLSCIELLNVNSLKNHYESNTVAEFTEKISSIGSLSTIETPLIEKDSKFYLDLSSRYFNEDFIYGLAIIKSFGIIADTKTPTIDLVLEWHSSLLSEGYFSNGDFLKTIDFLPHTKLSLEKLCNIYNK